MFETLDRIERYFVRRLSPGALKRFDKWLRLHHPLVWRTRIHWVIWWIGFPSTAWCMLVMLGPRPSSDTLDGPGLMTYGTMLGFSLSVGGVALWCRKQMQTPLGERRWTSRVLLTAADAAVVAALFAPLWITILPLTYLTAHSMPTATLNEELPFHRDHGYWRCIDPANFYAIIAESRQRLEASLAHFGMTTMGTSISQLCPTDLGDVSGLTLVTLNAGSIETSTEALQERLESIADSKQLWEENDGPLVQLFFGEYVTIVLMIAAGVSLLLAIRGTPRYVIDRSIAPYVPYHRLEPSHFLPRVMPAWLARLDRHLRLHRPVFWATRAHVVALYSVCWLATLITAGFLLREDIARARVAMSITNDDDFVYLGLSALGLPLVWALSMRRGDVPATSPASSKLLVDGFCLAVLPLPFAHGQLLQAISSANSSALYHSALRASYMVFLGLLVLSLCLIRNYRSVSATGTAGYAGLFFTAVAIGLHDHLAGIVQRAGIDSSETAWLVGIAVSLTATFGLLARSIRNANFATLLIVLAPTLVLYVAFTLMTLEAEFWTVIASLLTFYPIYRYGVVPLVTVLAESRHGPQER